jgi:hypothetical protein
MTPGPSSPRRLTNACALVATTVALSAFVAPTPAAAQARTDHFELNSRPKVALHHLLVDWAQADAGDRPFYATPIAERATWRVRLDDDEAAAWSAALRAYDAAAGRSFVFDDGMIALRDYANGGPRAALAPDDRPLADALDAALPVYESTWWPEHRLRNDAWIAAVLPVLDALEEDVIRRLEVAYGARWPDARIPADVVPYANDVGAYSTADRLTFESNDPGLVMPRAVEMVFHEASHVGALEGALKDALDETFRRAGGTAPDRLWHDLIFYSTGEIVRIVLEERGLPGYAHYGEATGAYTRADRWPPQLEAFEAHWLPFLRSSAPDDAARRAALDGVARMLLGDG